MASPRDIRAGGAFVEIALDKKYKQGLAEAKTDFERFATHLDGIKKRFGPRSFLKDVVELGVGGGALAGITFLTKTVAELSGKLADASDELRTGKRAVGEITGELLRQVPILGDATKFWDNLLGAVTGTRSEVDALTKSVEAANEKMEETAKLAGLLDKVRSNLGGQQKDRNEARTTKDLAGDKTLGGGIKRALNDADLSAEAAKKKLRDAVLPDLRDALDLGAKSSRPNGLRKGMLPAQGEATPEQVWSRAAAVQKRIAELQGRLSGPAPAYPSVRPYLDESVRNAPEKDVAGLVAASRYDSKGYYEAIANYKNALKEREGQVGELGSLQVLMKKLSPLLNDLARQEAEIDTDKWRSLAKLASGNISEFFQELGTKATEAAAKMKNAYNDTAAPYAFGNAEYDFNQPHKRNVRASGIPFVSAETDQASTAFTAGQAETRRLQREIARSRGEVQTVDRMDKEDFMKDLQGRGIQGAELKSIEALYDTLQKEGSRPAAGGGSSQGTFNAAAVQSLVAGGGGAIERTAVNTERTAKAVENSAATIKRIDKAVGEVLTYA